MDPYMDGSVKTAIFIDRLLLEPSYISSKLRLSHWLYHSTVDTVKNEALPSCLPQPGVKKARRARGWV